MSRALLEEAARFARRQDARLLEGYPVDRPGRSADAIVYTGLASAFAKAGFRELARRSPTRPIVRRSLGRLTPARLGGHDLTRTPGRVTPRGAVGGFGLLKRRRPPTSRWA